MTKRRLMTKNEPIMIWVRLVILNCRLKVAQKCLHLCLTKTFNNEKKDALPQPRCDFFHVGNMANAKGDKG